MGVRKLLSYVREQEAAVAVPLELPKEDGTRAKVLVDAYAMWITVAEQATKYMEDVVPNECLFHDADVVGGDCLLACEALHRFVLFMRDVCNVDLVFLRDAPRGVDGATSYRDAVWNKRELERQRVTQQHYDYCRGDSPRKYSVTDGAAQKPLPYLLFRAMGGVLKRLGVPMVVLDGEVDLSIGSMFHEFGASFLIAGDTDFLVMPNIPTVLLQTLPWDVLLQDSSEMASALVPPLALLTSERLSQHLGLTGSQLCLLACLLGNDITDELTTFRGQIPELSKTIKANDKDQVEDAAAPWYIVAGLLKNQGPKPKKDGRRKKHAIKEKKPDTSGVEALSYEAEEKSPAELVKKSCAEYVSASRRQAYVPAAFPGVSETIRRLYRSGDIAPHVLPLVAHGITFTKLPPWETDTPCPSALPTILRAEKATWRLLGKEVIHVVNAAEGTVQECSACDDQQVPLTGEDLLMLSHDSPNLDVKLSWVRKALAVQQDGNEGGRVTFEECVLWVVHSGMFNMDELIVVAMMVEVLQHDNKSQHHDDRFEWQKEVCQSHRMNEKPFPRCLDIVQVVATAYSIVGDLYDLLGLSALAIRPEQLYSGTVLHCLFTCYQREGEGGEVGAEGKWYSTLPSGLVDNAMRAIRSTEIKFGPMAGGWLSGVAPPRGVRMRVDWVGLLQRDEVVDFLDGCSGGATTATIQGKAKVATSQEQHEAADIAAANPLPILEFLPNTLDTIERYPVVCIQGDTGCGKSSMVPLHLYLRAKEKKQRVCIIVTQPRRLAAISLARRVASLLNETVGETVGYRIGGGDDFHVESARTCIFFVTTGYLLEALVHGSNLWSRSTHIVLDEVHERTIESDMLSLVIKLTRGPEESHHRLVLMSATLQIELFTNYFKTIGMEKVPTLQVGCKRYHIEEHFIDETIQELGSRVPKSVCDSLHDYMNRVEKCGGTPFPLRPEHIHAITNIILACVKHGSCILVFLPGLNEIEMVFEDLTSAVKRMGNVCTVRICTLHSVVEIEEQHRAVDPSTPNECKIVLSTNIAETSITIPDVKVVIDLGMARRVEYDTKKKIRALICGWCSKSAMRQRAGRAGRVSNGIVYRLYTKETVDLMKAFDASEFMPLEYSVLQVHAHLNEYGDVCDLMQQLPDPPPAELVEAALDNLISWGAVSKPPDLELTSLGKLALRMPIDVALTRAILMASALGCAAEMVVIAAGFTLQRSLFPRPLRSFYNSDREYIASLVAVDKTMEHFDRRRRSDIHMFISIYEEATQHSNHHKMMHFAKSQGIASKQLGTFVKYVQNVASRLLQDPAPFLHNADKQLLESMSARTSEQRKPISFGVFRSPSNDLCLQLVLSCSAELIFFGQRKMTPGFCEKGAPAEMRGEAGRRTVVFDGVGGHVKAAMTIDDLRREFEQLFGSVERIAFDSSNTLRVTFSEPKDDSIGSDVISLTEVFPPTAYVQTLQRISRQHPAKRELLPFRRGDIAARFPAAFDDVSPDCFEFPNPLVACALKGIKGVLISEGLPLTTTPDRWSVLFGASDAAQPDNECTTLTQLGCGFAVMRQGKGVGTSMAMLLCTIRSFPFAAVIASHRDKLGAVQLGVVAASPAGETSALDMSQPMSNETARKLQDESARLIVTAVRIGKGTIEDLPGAPLSEVIHLANIVLLLIELVQRGEQDCSAVHLAYLHSQLNAMFLERAPLGVSKAVRKNPVWTALIPLVVPFQGADVVLLHAEAMTAWVLGLHIHPVITFFSRFVTDDAGRDGERPYEDDNPGDDPAFVIQQACMLLAENDETAFSALTVCRLTADIPNGRRGGGLSEQQRWLDEIRRSNPPRRSHGARRNPPQSSSLRKKYEPPQCQEALVSTKKPQTQRLRGGQIRDQSGEIKRRGAAKPNPEPPVVVDNDEDDDDDDQCEDEFIRMKSNGTWKCVLCGVTLARQDPAEFMSAVAQHQHDKKHMKRVETVKSQRASLIKAVEKGILKGTCFTVKNELLWCTVCGCAVSPKKKVAYKANRAKSAILNHSATTAHQQKMQGSAASGVEAPAPVGVPHVSAPATAHCPAAAASSAPLEILVDAVAQLSLDANPRIPQVRAAPPKGNGSSVSRAPPQPLPGRAEDATKSDDDDDEDDDDMDAAASGNDDLVFHKKKNGQVRCKGCKVIVARPPVAPEEKARLIRDHRLQASHVQRAANYIAKINARAAAKEAEKAKIRLFLQGTCYAILEGQKMWCTMCNCPVGKVRSVAKAQVATSMHDQEDLHRAFLQQAVLTRTAVN